MDQPFVVQDRTLHSIRLDPGTANPSADIELICQASTRTVTVSVRAHPSELTAAYDWVLAKLKA